MTDILKQAKELIEQFDGKITEGEWDIDASIYAIQHIALDGEREWLKKPAEYIDIEAMSSAPQMIAVIKELVKEIEDSQNDK